MRTTILLLSLVALATAANAQVFTSGFENWNDTLPTDWFGVKSNISSDSIEQVTTNVHAGTYAVRVINAPSATKRFTTQPLHVDSAQAYDVTYWVRGQGDIRASLFDGRSENFGYSPNTSYVVVNGDTWTQQTSTLICDHTNDAAEFILYVRNTTGPDRIVVDDVNIILGINTGMGEFANNGISVFPNPANTLLTLNIPGVTGRTQYTFTDATGRAVLSANVTAERNTIDVSALPVGVYALTLRNGSSVRSTRIAVQR
ncbi:MAG: T9SS type A sorting domain-containing protein [Flavobacteriales bacterium]